MRIVAILAAFNEERFIGGCIEHLRAQGVESYLIDNQSSDGTLDIARRYLGAGLCGVESLAHDGVFHWRRILQRKEELAAQLEADWFLHLDPDEIPLAPDEGATLGAALEAVDRAGYNAVEFDEFTFVPTREAPDHDHAEFRSTMRWYYPFAPQPMHLVRAWRRQTEGVDLSTSGGHVAAFGGRRIAPQRFRLRHYLFLSAGHARRKYLARRFDEDELRASWHGWRAALEPDAIVLPAEAELRAARGDADLDPSAPRLRHCLDRPEGARATPAAAGGGSPTTIEAAPERRRRGTRRRPVVLCLVDRPDWAHDRKTRALERHLSAEFQIVKRYQSEVSAADLWRADLVLLYYWLQVERLGDLAGVLRRRRRDLLIGISSHVELEHGRREPGLRLLAELPCAVFANNRGLVAEFEPLLGRPVAYTPNGVDTGFFRPGRASRGGRRLRVGWAGSLTNQGDDHRGVSEVIAPAVAMVPGAELCLAVREERWRGAEEMLRFYHSIDVYVCASRSEGTPNPCLEAAACGVPVVTTRVGNMPELIRDGENGFFVERHPPQLAEKLTWLLEDRSLRKEMGMSARRSSEAWDWRIQATHYGALFASALGNRSEVPVLEHADR